jgi:predicted N-formylglutamate amidohydrolase
LNIILSCEHATNAIPPELHNLGLAPHHLESHIAYDKGAKNLARAIAQHLSYPLVEGKYSRLVVDCNRSIENPHFIRGHSFGVEVPGNVRLSSQERKRRIDLYYMPFYNRLSTLISQEIMLHGRAVHLSIHSFDENVDIVKRGHIEMDFMHDGDNRLATGAAQFFRAMGWKAYINQPYHGYSDGINKVMSKKFGNKFLSLQIDCNDRIMERKELLLHMVEFIENIFFSVLC